MVDCTKEKNPPYKRRLSFAIRALAHRIPGASRSQELAPDGTPCEANTSGLLQLAHIIAREFRYVGKETDRKWEEGDDPSVLDFKTTEYGRAKKIVADTAIADEIRAIGIRMTMELTKMSQHTIEKLVRGEAVTRKTHAHVLKAIHAYRSKNLTLVTGLPGSP